MADAVSQLIDEQVSVLVLADVGALDRETLAKVDGLRRAAAACSLRFAGSRLAAGNDDLVPVRLRRGGRSLGGTLSWDTPQHLRAVHPRKPVLRPRRSRTISASAARSSPSPTAISPRRPGRRSQDGTPIVTADKRGEGLIVLFHVTADTTWSNLPLSGLFVDMLRRIVGAGRRADDVGAEARNAGARRRSRRG